MKTKDTITLRAFLVGTFFAALFAFFTVYIGHTRALWVTATQIPVLPYVLLILMVLLVNPICRLLRIARAFAAGELMIIFIMGMVSSGVSTFGLMDQVIPMVGGLFNSEWNTRQNEWNRYVVPFMNNEYYLSTRGRGIQRAAISYHEALSNESNLKSAHDAARRYAIAREQAELSAAALQNLESLDVACKELDLARIESENARSALEEAEAEWEKLKQSNGLPSLEAVIKEYPAKIEAAENEVQTADEELTALEQEAFEKVELFRRGLPKGVSSYPGFFPMPGDNSRSYFGRMRRLAEGKEAVALLKRGLVAVSGASERVEGEEALAAASYAESASAKLRPMAESSDLEAERDVLRSELELLSERRVALNLELRQRSAERRAASRSEALAMESRLREIDSELKKEKQRENKLMAAKERNDRELACATKIGELADDIDSLAAALRGSGMGQSEFRRAVSSLLADFVSVDVSLKRYFIGEVPWSHWARPMAKWGLVSVLTWAILMSLNLLLFRQWAYHEKLTYPLAELPKALVGGADAGGGLPAVFGNGLFWVGLAVSGTVMGWNLLCVSQLVPGLSPFNLSNYWSAYVAGTAFRSLAGTRSMVFFTMIALSFLIPRNISFSLWFFHVLYMVLMLTLVWSGHGVDERSFPNDWLYLLNFRTALGQGAIIVFSSVVLFKCRKYILCAFAPSMLQGLEDEERRELRVASFIFVAGSLALVLILWRDMGANLYYVLLVYFLIIVITIGLMRAVTEGGLLSFQAWANPFHFIRAVFGLDKGWSCTSMFAPLMVYYSVFFLDIKTFIAPAMANAIKLRDDFRMRRGLFHLAVIAAILLAAVTALITSLMLSYDGGADSMSSWFYTMFPRGTFNTLRAMIKNAPSSEPEHAWWIAGGGAVMAALLYLRQFVFWLPHPLGMVMMISPLMGAYWFSILLGWLCNVAVTKYGNKNTYQRATGFFVGLIVGELLIIVLAMIVSIVIGQNIGIDLNRN